MCDTVGENAGTVPHGLSVEVGKMTPRGAVERPVLWKLRRTLQPLQRFLRLRIEHAGRGDGWHFKVQRERLKHSLHKIEVGVFSADLNDLTGLENN